MNFYIKTFRRAVEEQIGRAATSSTPHIILTAPSLDASLMLKVTEAVNQHCAVNHRDFKVVIKMAGEMVSSWDKTSRTKADSCGWIVKGSLTEWRNKDFGAEPSLLLLLGTDRIPDQGSLADFLSLSTDFLWKNTMKESFSLWARGALKLAQLDDTIKNQEPIKEVLDCVSGLPGSGLQSISAWLDAMHISECTSAEDMRRKLLSDLSRFGMPSLASYTGTSGRRGKKLATYIREASSVFTPGSANESRKKSYLKAIEKAMNEIAEGESLIDDSACGSFSSPSEMLAALSDHIGGTDRTAKQKLLACDFVPVLDKVLRPVGTPPPIRIPKTKTVIGEPVDVFLFALWKTLRVFFDRYRKSSSDTVPRCISVRAQLWKYASDMHGSADSVAEYALGQLKRLVGGIEELFEKRLCGDAIARAFPECECAFQVFHDDLKCSTTPAMNSSLLFSVVVDDVERSYEWKISPNEDWPLSMALLQRCGVGLPKTGPRLPTFRLAFYEELLASSSEGDTREILRHALGEADTESRPFCINMLSDCSDFSDDPLKTGPFSDLGRKYTTFVDCCLEGGLLNAVFIDKSWSELHAAYKEACRQAREAAIDEQILPSMMMRAFLVTPEDGYNPWKDELSSGIVTMLHPALIEMFEARISYLFACFGTACCEAFAPETSRFPSQLWLEFLALAEIHSPIEVLRCQKGLLAVDARGSSLIHRIGNLDGGKAKPLSTRLAMDADDNGGQFRGSDLFTKSSESKMLFHIMKNYYETHARAWDGIRIAFFRNSDIQPVISAVDQFLLWLASEKGKECDVSFAQRLTPYRLQLDFYTDVKDEADISGYIAQWNDIWQEKAMTRPDLPYAKTSKRITHSIIPLGGDSKAAPKRLDNIGFCADIAFFFDIADFGEPSAAFYKEKIDSSVYARLLQFPILEKKDCIRAGELKSRSRIITHRQFELSEAFTDLVAGIDKQQDIAFVLRAKVDFSNWADLLSYVHDKSDWVACVDVSVDKDLLKACAQTCDVISFGSGIGRSGEANFTVSTKQTSASDLEVSLKQQIRSLYADQPWTDEECAEMAANIRRDSANLTGLSLIRAASHQDKHVHDFIAHTLSYRFLKKPDDAVCNMVVSLDDYPHWFSSYGDEQKEPDLLWLTVQADAEGRPVLHARVVECKLAQGSDKHLRKAREQVRAGYECLSALFVPRSGREDSIDDFKPDRRYWWMQLHRIVSSAMGAVFPGSAMDKSNFLLENLAEGRFSIDWGGAVFAFWTNWDESEAPFCASRWKIGDADAMVWIFSPRSFRALALDTPPSMDWTDLLVEAKQAPEELQDFCFDESSQDLPPDSSLGDDEYDMHDDDDDDTVFIETPVANRPPLDDDPSEECPLPSAGEAASHPSKPDAKPDTASLKVSNPTAISVGDDKPAAQIEDKTPPSVVPPTALPDLASIRIYLGEAGQKKIYWEFGHPGLTNRHLLVFGAAGSGKTYALQCILCELAKCGMHSLILDNTGSYTPTEIKPGAEAFFPDECQQFISQNPLELNPFKGTTEERFGRVFSEKPSMIAKRITPVFRKIFHLGEIQTALLSDEIEKGIEDYGDGFSCQTLLARLEELLDDKKYAANANSLLLRIKNFLKTPPFAERGELSWEKIFSGELHNKILQFYSIDPDSSRAAIDFLLWNLYAYALSHGTEADPKVIVIDEVQNQNLESGSAIAKFITEGRKFGLALVSATQTIAGLGGSGVYAVNTLMMSGGLLFFKPALKEVNEFAKELNRMDKRFTTSEWAERLNKLQKGECYFVGPQLNEATQKLGSSLPIKVKIASLQEREF